MRKHFLYNLLNIFSRIINFFLFWFIANQLGASIQSDWFFYVFGVVYFLISIFFYTTECTLVPYWNELSSKNQQSFYSSAISFVLLSILPIQLAGALVSFGAPDLVGLSPPGSLYLIWLVSFLFFLHPPAAFISSIYCSYLQASGNYFSPITHLTYRAIGIFLVLLAWPDNSYDLLCFTVAYTCGELLRLIVLHCIVRKNLQLSQFKFGLNFSRFKHLYFSLLMMGFTTCSFAANPYVDFLMGAHTGPGNATLIEYASKLRGIPFLLLNGVLVVLLGDWVRTKGDTIKWVEIRKAATILGVIGFIFSVFFLLAKGPLIDFFFVDGKLSNLQEIYLLDLLYWYLLGIPALIAGNVVARGIITLKLFKIYALLGIASFIINIILNYIFIQMMGVQGVALSTTILDVIMLFALVKILKAHCRDNEFS